MTDSLSQQSKRLTFSQAERVASDAAYRAIERGEEVFGLVFTDEQWDKLHDHLAADIEAAICGVDFPVEDTVAMGSFQRGDSES